MQHIGGSINLPLDELLDGTQKSVDVLSKIPKDSEIWAYCVSGARSSIAVGVLKDAGYENVLNKRSVLDL
jgi:rhodanese-related sulfurtransferase